MTERAAVPRAQEWEVRVAGPGDRDELVRLRTALWPDSTPEEVDGLLAASTGLVLVVAPTNSGGVPESLDGVELVGFAEVGARDYAEGCTTTPVAYLEGIWVDPARRREGVATALVREATRWGADEGFLEFASDCDIGNEASRRFHIHVGFIEVQHIVTFRRSLGSYDGGTPNAP